MSTFNYAWMQLVREARGLSQTNLADAIGCTQATISRWEYGLFQPNENEIDLMCKTLRVPKSFLVRNQEPSSGGLPVFYHRALVSAPGYVTSCVNARCFMRALQIEAAAKFRDFPQHEIPTLPSDKFSGGAAEVARAVRAAWRIGSGPIPNLVGLIESKGGIVIIEDLGCDEVDALCWWRPGLPKLFFVNARKPACRMRFSLAHELGHTIMHTHPTDPATAEQEADAFAAEFLFPLSDARATLSVPLTLPRLATLKPWWKMSMAAIAMRAKDANVITPEQFSKLMRDLAARGWRKREPVEVPHEAPTLLGKMLRYPLNQLGWSRSDLANAMHMNEDELNGLLDNNLVIDDQSLPLEEKPWLRLVS